MGQGWARQSRAKPSKICIIPLFCCFVCFFPVVETPLRVDVQVLKVRARLLQKYLSDEQKELQALYALQALVVTLEQPASKSQAAGEGGAEGLPATRLCSWKVLNAREAGRE